MRRDDQNPVSDADNDVRDGWAVADILISDAGDKDMAFPTNCEAVSIAPDSEADAIYVQTVQGQILVTSKTPFVGGLQGPIYYVPFYDPGQAPYSVRLIFWVKRPYYLPPTFLDTDLVGARNKFSV